MGKKMWFLYSFALNEKKKKMVLFQTTTFLFQLENKHLSSRVDIISEIM